MYIMYTYRKSWENIENVGLRFPQTFQMRCPWETWPTWFADLWVDLLPILLKNLSGKNDFEEIMVMYHGPPTMAHGAWTMLHMIN